MTTQFLNQKAMDLFKKISEILSLGSTVTIVIAKGKDEKQIFLQHFSEI